MNLPGCKTAAACLMAALALSGCASVRETAKAVTQGSPAVVRRSDPGSAGMLRNVAVIGLAPAAANLPAGYGALFESVIAAALEKDCRGVQTDLAAAGRLKSPPRAPGGAIDGHALALLGRRQGVGFFVFGSLSDVRHAEEKTGFWLWKDTRYAARVTVRVEAFDADTAAKILDETIWQDMPLAETVYEELQAGGRLDLDSLKGPLAAIHLKAAQRLCTVLREQPWTGFVVAADGGRLTISAGTRAGLAPGRLVDVFAAGRLLESKEGLRYILPGPKIGTAEIISAAADEAQAVLREPGPSAAGGTVRISR